MKQLLIISLLFIFLLPTLVKVEILLDFKINQDFISEVLCINKEEPMTMCYGKCYLAKELNNAEEQEQKGLPNSVNQKLEILLCHYTESIQLNTPFHKEDKPGPEFSSNLYQSIDLQGIFHPPKNQLI